MVTTTIIDFIVCFVTSLIYKKELIGAEYNVWFLKTSILSTLRELKILVGWGGQMGECFSNVNKKN